MNLTFLQKQEFIKDGYLKIPGVVPRIMVEEALRAINHSVGAGIPSDQVTKMQARSYCTELQATAVITDLINKTPALNLTEALVGPGQLPPVKSGQVALRFPSPPADNPRLWCHLDGMPTKDNGVPFDGKVHSFTLLMSVLLSRLDGPFTGNFTVWPGTHRLFETYFREHGPEILLKEGMPKITYPEPVQITGEPGDVVIAHYQLAHTAAPNYGPHVRYACFYRMSHVRRAESGCMDLLTDIWQEWDGIRDLVPRANAREPVLAQIP